MFRHADPGFAPLSGMFVDEDHIPRDNLCSVRGGTVVIHLDYCGGASGYSRRWRLVFSSGGAHISHNASDTMTEMILDQHVRAALHYRAGETFAGQLTDDAYVHLLAVTVPMVGEGDCARVSLLRRKANTGTSRRLHSFLRVYREEPRFDGL